MFSPMSSGRDDWSDQEEQQVSSRDASAVTKPAGYNASGGSLGLAGNARAKRDREELAEHRKLLKRDLGLDATGRAAIPSSKKAEGGGAGATSRLTRAWKGKLANGGGGGGTSEAKGGELSSLGSILRRKQATTAVTAAPSSSSRRYGPGAAAARAPFRVVGGAGELSSGPLRGIGGGSSSSNGTGRGRMNNGKGKALLGGTPDLNNSRLDSRSIWLDEETEPLLPAASRVPRPRKNGGLESSRMTSLFGDDGTAPSSSNRLPKWREAFRPSAETVDVWLDSWIKRWMVLAIIPSLVVSSLNRPARM